MSTTLAIKGNMQTLQAKEAKIDEKEEALIGIVPRSLGALNFRMSRHSVNELKEDVWQTARKNGWLSS